MSFFRRLSIRTILASAWLTFTLSMVIWWWIYALGKSTSESSPEHRMILMEGAVLFGFVLVGGVYLIILSYRDYLHHQSLQLFFSNFSHDIKTSIARLRLQADVIEEESKTDRNPILGRLVQDIHRLDLQLENSLLYSSLNKSNLVIQDLILSEIIKTLRPEFPELGVALHKNCQIKGDPRAVLCLFRNLFSNSVNHGQAQSITITALTENSNRVRIVIADDGLGYDGETSALGKKLHGLKSETGSGLGLYLTRALIEKVGGSLSFESQKNRGFKVTLQLGGRLI